MTVKSQENRQIINQPIYTVKRVKTQSQGIEKIFRFRQFSVSASIIAW